MPAFHGRKSLALAAVAALATACSNMSAPQSHLADPVQLSADLQTISGVFQSPVFESFAVIDTATGSPAAVAPRAGALLEGAPIGVLGTAAQTYANAVRRLQALRTAGRVLGPGILTSVIPPPLLGTTFVWDVPTHAYVQSSSATPPAPANAVRIILYVIDPASGHIVESPLTPVGYVDLVDQSSGNTNSLQVTVFGGTPGASGNATYADYTVTATVTGSPVVTGFNASATGVVTDGTHTLNFSGTFGVTGLDTDNPDFAIDGTWDLDNSLVHIVSHEILTTPDANHATITLTYSVTHGNETVSAIGSIVVVVSPQTLTVDLGFAVNDVPFARIAGTNNGITVLHADGSLLSADETQAVSDLFTLPARLQSAVETLFNPARHLMGG
ncbi:MAG TPA: hypothetical protein VJN39_14365 [Gemmatimonadales bacterium]|nr:hypothetical protein [Gemmatimonadales bacterium]